MTLTEMRSALSAPKFSRVKRDLQQEALNKIGSLLPPADVLKAVELSSGNLTDAE
jgi:hypothetical protein